MIYPNIIETIGNTPLIPLSQINKNIYAKVEFFNPSGSIKDRAAFEIIQNLIKTKQIQKGGTLIIPTSGNMGISTCMISQYYNLDVVVVMPENMSIERRKLLLLYGAKIILTPSKLGMKGSIDKAKSLLNTIPNSYLIKQFEDQMNINAHIKTAREIDQDLPEVEVIVASIGTGGTIRGILEYFKNSQVEVIGVEPQNSPLITKGQSGKHNIQGIGANFIPNLIKDVLSLHIETISEQEAYETCFNLAKKEGIVAGISSGAALSVAIQLSKLPKYQDKKIVVILPDTGERYLSSELMEKLDEKI